MDTASNIRATCSCTAPIMIRAGRVVCSTCSAPIESGLTALPEIYSSEGPLPDRWSRRRFLERVRTMPEAQRVGGKRGRGVVYSISRTAWEASFAAVDAPSNVVPIASVDALIAGAGYRATKRAS